MREGFCESSSDPSSHASDARDPQMKLFEQQQLHVFDARDPQMRLFEQQQLTDKVCGEKRYEF